MKITVDVECTPEELRAFFGLPDVQPMQQVLMTQIQDRMSASLQAADPEVMFRTWLPAGVQGMENLQKLFWSHFAGGAARAKEDKS